MKQHFRSIVILLLGITLLHGCRESGKDQETTTSQATVYYGGDILDKVGSKRFTYRFSADLVGLIGYSPEQLDRLGKEQQDRRAAETKARYY